MSELERIYTISDVAELTEQHQSTIRSWEEKLGDAFYVPRDAQRNRYYTSQHIELIKIIKELRDENYSMPMIQKFILKMMEKQSSSIPSNSTEEEGGGQSLVPTQAPGSALQQQQMHSLVVDMSNRLNGFLANLDTVLNSHVEKNEEMLSRHIAELKELSLESSTEVKAAVNQQIQENMSTIQAGVKETIQTSVNSLSEEMQKNLDNWAVVTREQLKDTNTPKRKGLLGFLTGGGK